MSPIRVPQLTTAVRFCSTGSALPRYITIKYYCITILRLLLGFKVVELLLPMGLLIG